MHWSMPKEHKHSMNAQAGHPVGHRTPLAYVVSLPARRVQLRGAGR